MEEPPRSLTPLREHLQKVDPEFLNNLDKNLKLFCREIRKELRNEKDVVIGVTGYPGLGKSMLTSTASILIDYNYAYDKNISFIPTSKDIEQLYLGLPMYSVLHIDEASRGLHKHKWHDRMQQKLNELYDTDREGHFLCTFLLMPRFQNFTENFRNFRIKYWINIVERGLAVVYKRDEDKDAKDPWHIDENYKLKEKKWRGKRIFERDVPDVIRMEQRTKNYWFYFEIPPLPQEVWSPYQKAKKDSRVQKEVDMSDTESYRDKITRERNEKLQKVYEMYKAGMPKTKIAVKMGVTKQTISNYFAYIKEMYPDMREGSGVQFKKRKDTIYSPIDSDNFGGEKGGFGEEQKEEQGDG